MGGHVPSVSASVWSVPAVPGHLPVLVVGTGLRVVPTALVCCHVSMCMFTGNNGERRVSHWDTPNQSLQRSLSPVSAGPRGRHTHSGDCRKG